MTSIASLILEVPDPTAGKAFYADFGVGAHVGVRAADAPTTGFRGYTLSLVVSQQTSSTPSWGPPSTAAPRG